MNHSDVDNQSANQVIAECSILREQFVSQYPVEIWKSNGFFQDADLMAINCHWLQFEPTKPLAHFVLAAIYVVVFAIGSVSNVVVIYILLR